VLDAGPTNETATGTDMMDDRHYPPTRTIERREEAIDRAPRITTDSGFRIRVEKDYLQFCAAHLILHENGTCEPLHGHNYRMTVTLFGGLQKRAGYIFDFIDLKALLRRLVNELDHRVLLAGENPSLPVTEPDSATVRMTTPSGGLYTFPRQDVCVLPIANTTTELLAYYMARRIRAELPPIPDVTGIEVEVEETPGQSATYAEGWLG